MATRSGHRLVASVFLLAGAVLLAGSLFLPWYSYSSTVMDGASCVAGTHNYTYYLGLPSWNGTVRGVPWCTIAYEEQSYDHAGLPSTGVVAATTLGIVVTAAAAGLLGGALGVAFRGRARWTNPALALAVVAAILGVAGPELYAVWLPVAYSNDVGGCSGGMCSSFTGSTGGGNGSVIWGPSIGWYLSVLACVVFFIGTLILFLYRRDPPEPVPLGAPEPVASPA